MDDILHSISELYKNWKGNLPLSIDILPPSGSERRYFRVLDNGISAIATYGANIKENEAFVYFSNHFKQKSLAVPQVFAINEAGTIYLQQDVGNTSLLNKIEVEGHSDNVLQLFKQSLSSLAALQVKGHQQLDYNKCLTNKEFGKQAIMADLLYFKYYFLDALRKPYDKQKLIEDFDALSNYLTHTEYKYFMFRDFQSRNIMIQNDEVCFIDYQGGMLGAPQYDVASMLWQAKANLPIEWKQTLLAYYMDAFESCVGAGLDKNIFQSQYNGYVLIRLLQVLGAYGFRGLFERKAHFLTSIPFALKNLKEFVSNNNLGIALSGFSKALDICIADDTIAHFTPIQADENTPLTVTICSFSYKIQLPDDGSENGGGFMFDCRGILNPGRIESMKKLTGRDKEVKDFLEIKTKMPEFLNSVFDVVDISVEDYLRRSFSSLMVSFGCTGGQHRSVYAADALARHLKNKFNVKIKLKHMVQDEKNWIN